MYPSLIIIRTARIILTLSIHFFYYTSLTERRVCGDRDPSFGPDRIE